MAPPGWPQLPRISDYARYYAETTPDVEALVLDDIRLTYRDVAHAVDRCARALLAADIGKGDRVAMLSTPRPEYFIAFLATVKIGGTWVGLNPRHRFDELGHVIDDAQPKIVFSLPAFEGRNYSDDLLSLKQRSPSLNRLVSVTTAFASAAAWDEFLASGAAVTDDQLQTVQDSVDALDPALLVYTSGTTGKPKGALLRHRGLTHCSRVQATRFPCTTLRILNNLPIDHVGCVGDISSFCLIRGGTMVFMERFDPAGILDVIERERVTFWGQVPTMFALTTEQPDFFERDFSSLEWIAWSGSSMPKALIERLGTLGARMALAYGLTETTGSVTYSDPEADVDTLADTIGRPDPNFDFRIANDMAPVSVPGEEGEIQVRGDWVMDGYLNCPAATEQAFTADGYLRTGDVAVYRSDGNIRLVGRLKEMFKSGGYNVYPREIEQCLETHPLVAMCAVIAAHDPIFGEVGHAFVLPVPGAELRSTHLEEFCRVRLANYKLPKRISVRRELPMLPIGKIDKRALAATEEQGGQP